MQLPALTTPILGYALAGVFAIAVAEGIALKRELALNATYSQANEQAEKTHEIEIRNQKQITEDTKNGWQAALEYVRAHRPAAPAPTDARGLRNPGSGALGGLSEAAAGDAGRAADRVPDPGAGQSCDSQLAELTDKCVETSVTCFALQTWVRRQVQASEMIK